MSEEQKLARNIQVLSNGKLEARNLDTCMTFGISGLCGKECPKFKDKTCEVYLDALESEYNNLQTQLQQKENIIKEAREDLHQVVKWCAENKHNEDTIERYLVVYYGPIVGKINEIRTKLDKEVK